MSLRGRSTKAVPQSLIPQSPQSSKFTHRGRATGNAAEHGNIAGGRAILADTYIKFQKEEEWSNWSTFLVHDVIWKWT